MVLCAAFVGSVIVANRLEAYLALWSIACMNLKTPFYIDALNYAFEQKKLRNEQFSLRAFARDLEINSGTLSRILKGDRVPSMTLGRQLALSLKLHERECDLFLNSLAQAKWDQAPERISQELRNFGRPQGEESREQKSAYKLELEKFRFLSDWIHYALMELTFVVDFSSCPKWMAARIGRSEKDVCEALKRLIDLGLVEYREGVLTKTNERVTTRNKTKTTPFLKMMQKDLLHHAGIALEQVEIDRRVASSMTMAIDPKNIERARSLFSHFLSDMCSLLEEGEQTEVYHLLVNLSPVNLDQKEIRNEALTH